MAEGKVNENGDYVLPDDVRYDKQVKQCQEKLDELANEGIYDKENNTIHIQDKDKLTDDEKSAIMIMLTGNPDIYSYAAENQFHALACAVAENDLKNQESIQKSIKELQSSGIVDEFQGAQLMISNIMQKGDEIIKNSGIVSNAGVGEAQGMEEYAEILFKTEGWFFYKEQKEAHTKE